MLRNVSANQAGTEAANARLNIARQPWRPQTASDNYESERSPAKQPNKDDALPGFAAHLLSDRSEHQYCVPYVHAHAASDTNLAWELRQNGARANHELATRADDERPPHKRRTRKHRETNIK